MVRAAFAAVAWRGGADAAAVPGTGTGAGAGTGAGTSRTAGRLPGVAGPPRRPSHPVIAFSRFPARGR
ncbi:hypothetical protein FLW16_25690 [Microbispora sp. KK1-11]|nr:hypothetical protein FLW16_25690 [Microbispora sp. KK1-11]